MLLSTLMFISCGKQHNAKKIVSDFLKENIKNAEISDQEFGKVDSTFYLTDSSINVMRTNAKKISYFNTNIHYSDAKTKNPIMFVNLKYTLINEQKKEIKCNQTFYLDNKFKGVISFKNK
jgi:hypothetical protein